MGQYFLLEEYQNNLSQEIMNFTAKYYEKVVFRALFKELLHRSAVYEAPQVHQIKELSTSFYFQQA